MRDSNEFEVMKGFLGDFVEKGSGTSPETLPPAPAGDPHLGENLDEKGNTKKGKRGSVGGGTPMNDTLDDIASAAASDIESGYVNDTQKGKGYDLFNDMVSKGALVDNLTIKKYEVGASIKEIETAMVEKGRVGEIAGRAVGKLENLGEKIGGKLRETGRELEHSFGRPYPPAHEKYAGEKLFGAGRAMTKTRGRRIATGATAVGAPAAVVAGGGKLAYDKATEEKEKGFSDGIEVKTGAKEAAISLAKAVGGGVKSAIGAAPGGIKSSLSQAGSNLKKNLESIGSQAISHGRKVVEPVKEYGIENLAKRTSKAEAAGKDISKMGTRLHESVAAKTGLAGQNILNKLQESKAGRMTAGALAIGTPIAVGGAVGAAGMKKAIGKKEED